MCTVSNARLRAARTFAYSDMYVKPYLDLDFSYSRMPAYTESGSNPLALSVDGNDQFIMGLSPTIEVGGRAALKNGAMLRPFMYVGASFLSQDEWTSSARSARRAGRHGGRSTRRCLSIASSARSGAGLEVMKAGGVDFRLQYEGRFSEHVSSHSAGAESEWCHSERAQTGRVRRLAMPARAAGAATRRVPGRWARRRC